ncbi:general odorant-binding protein 56a-like [Condylostylus longicornis]|uniref:general odorant-binding protein 56a-like n=1 Tax=Condylostylus longicornis TaxID=2530218 RepID=UPI00244DEC6D|nr:general odorant-binding protein 56a-like [Condylostylus longicornis]
MVAMKPENLAKLRNKQLKATKKCSEEIDISLIEYLNLMHNASEDATEPMQCFMECFYKKLNLMKDGEIQKEVIIKEKKKKLGKATATSIVEDCMADLPDNNDCAKAYKFHYCLNLALSEKSGN